MGLSSISQRSAAADPATLSLLTPPPRKTPMNRPEFSAVVSWTHSKQTLLYLQFEVFPFAL